MIKTVQIKSLLILLLFNLTGCRINGPNESDIETTTTLNKGLDEYFTALSVINRFNGVVQIEKNSDVILYKKYEMQDAPESMQVSINSQFDIHSISKLMAQAAIVQLEIKKSLSSADTIDQYIDNFPNGDKITIQHLLDNQSGLPRDLTVVPENLIDYTPAEFVELIKKEQLLFNPGSQTLYSNIGYQLVYYIISKASGKPFVAYLNENMFTPYHMDYTGAHFYLDRKNLSQPVINHELKEDQITTLPNYKNSSKNQSKIYSTTIDLMNFIKEMKNEPYKSALINSKNNIGWSGGGDGILSHVSTNFNNGYEIVFFSNYDEIPFGQILEDVNKIMMGEEVVIPQKNNRKEVIVESELLEKYVGRYDMAEFNHDIFELRLENGKMLFYQNDEFGGILKAENDSMFFDNSTDEDYFILRKADKDIYNLVFKYKGVDVVGTKLID